MSPMSVLNKSLDTIHPARLNIETAELKTKITELQLRPKAKEKKQNHIEQAKRLEGLPLLKLQHDEFKEETRVLWKEQEQETTLKKEI